MKFGRNRRRSGERLFETGGGGVKTPEKAHLYKIKVKEKSTREENFVKNGGPSKPTRYLAAEERLSPPNRSRVAFGYGKKELNPKVLRGPLTGLLQEKYYLQRNALPSSAGHPDQGRKK